MESCLLPSTIPQRGALCIIVPGISNVPITNGTTGNRITYQWPRRIKLTEMMIVPTSGLKTDLAQLSMSIYDEKGDLISTGQQQAGQAAVPLLQLFGVNPLVLHLTGWTWAPAWKDFTRVVRGGERWQFQITNAKAGGGSITPVLAFNFEELDEPSPRVRAPLARGAIR